MDLFYLDVLTIFMKAEATYRVTLMSDEAIVTLPTVTFVVNDTPRSMLDIIRRMKP